MLYDAWLTKGGLERQLALEHDSQLNEGDAFTYENEVYSLSATTSSATRLGRPAWTRSVVFASIPIAVLAVLLQRRLARGPSPGSSSSSARAPPLLTCAKPSPRALGDPSLELAYCGFRRPPVTSIPAGIQSQADAIQRQVDAGSVDLRMLVDSGVVTDAQM